MSVNFHIKTKNIDLTPDISSHIHTKLAVIEKYIALEGDQEILAEIEVGRRLQGQQKGDVYRAEANVSCDGAMYRATTRAESIEAALDELKDEIGRVIKRKKNKRIDIRRAGGRLLKKLLRKNK